MSRRGAFDRVLAAVHGAAFDDARWPEVSALVDDACGIKGNMVVHGGGGAERVVPIYLAGFYYRGERNEELERRYLQELYPIDERVPRLRALPDSRLVHVSELYTDEEKKTSETYNALPLADARNSLTVRMDGSKGSRIVWAFADPVGRDGWSFERTGMVERLLPHLRQYVRVRQALADMGGLKASLATLLDYGSTGVIQLNRRGRIVVANDRARDFLSRQDGLIDEGGLLHTPAPEDNDRLQRLLARALPPAGGPGAAGSMVVTHRRGLSRPVLHVTPVGPRDGDVPPSEVAALVLVVDPYSQLPVDRALVETTLDLSPAESRIAVLLAGGNTVREVALATGRSVNTVRWHIRQIFQKHGLSRLDQLGQLVRSLGAHSGRGP